MSAHGAELARRYGGVVDRFSIWNEPNYFGWLAPIGSAPKLYRAMYVEGYNAIKAAAPNAQVLIAETSPYKIPRRATAPLDVKIEVAFPKGAAAGDRYADMSTVNR